MQFDNFHLVYKAFIQEKDLICTFLHTWYTTLLNMCDLLTGGIEVDIKFGVTVSFFKMYN